MLLSSAVLVAQTPPPQPTFRSGVTLVTTDVITRDGNGRFVSDLTKDELHRPRRRAAADDLVVLAGAGRTHVQYAGPGGGTVAAPEGIVLPTQRKPTTDAAGRVILVFVDDLHFEPEYTPHVRRLIEQLVGNLLHEGDMMAMVSSGPSAIEIGLTYDRKLVAASASKVRGSGITAAEIFQMLETSQGPADIRHRAQIAFYTAYNFINELDKIANKRKAVIYISTGYDFDPYAAARKGRDRVQGGRFSEPTRFLLEEGNPYFELPTITADIALRTFVRELTLAANRANATLFTVDPRGLSGIVDAGQFLDQSEWRTYIQKTQSSLRSLAEETGRLRRGQRQRLRRRRSSGSTRRRATTT